MIGMIIVSLLAFSLFMFFLGYTLRFDYTEEYIITPSGPYKAYYCQNPMITKTIFFLWVGVFTILILGFPLAVFSMGVLDLLFDRVLLGSLSYEQYLAILRQGFHLKLYPTTFINLGIYFVLTNMAYFAFVIGYRGFKGLAELIGKIKEVEIAKQIPATEIKPSIVKEWGLLKEAKKILPFLRVPKKEEKLSEIVESAEMIEFEQRLQKLQEKFQKYEREEFVIPHDLKMLVALIGEDLTTIQHRLYWKEKVEKILR